MQFGVNIPNMGDAVAVVRLAHEAEEAGWDGVFVWDHLHFLRSEQIPVHDPWVLLGAIATRTHRVRLGTMVTPVARRRPWKLAKELTTLDHLSGGRAVLGVGLGEPADDDFGAFGDPTDGRERAVRLDEGLELVAALVQGEPVVHHGARYDVDAHLLPASVQRPRPPVWVAGIWPNPRPLARALRWDGYVPIGGGPDDWLTPERLHDVARALGERPEGFELVAAWVPGTPADEYRDAGVTWLIESTWPLGDWMPELRDRVRLGPPR